MTFDVSLSPVTYYVSLFILSQGAAMNDRREIFGWTMYDWANSAFSTTVVSVFFGPYLSALAKAAADANGLIYLLGIPIRFDSLFPYCVSISVGLQVIFLPLLGAMADFSHMRKQMLVLFSTLGAVSSLLLFFATAETLWLSALLFIVANLSFGAGIVFYNAYLPSIASEDQRDRVSSRGFAMGYAGGGILLLLNLILFQFSAPLGISEGMAVRISLASAGVWWLLFSQITFRTLRPRHAVRQIPPGETLFSIGFKQLGNTFRQIRQFPETVRFLIGYLIYNDGIQTVIVVATLFGSQELEMDSTSLILVILMVQVVAFVGAFFFGWLAGQVGAKRAIVLSLFVWSGVVIYAAAALQSVGEFWVLSAVVALVLGGSQALSRSLFADMIPHGREAEFFSFYEISDRFTSIFGPLIFGLANQITGSLRAGIFSLVILFVVGLGILIMVNVPRAIREAEAAQLEEVGATAGA
ncbi:MAG: MFS transporter [Chloroflexi bacterium]|nr:MFS transporter [Chloroflexota bacterium]